jgi:linoleoyl-CoA desaturase
MAQQIVITPDYFQQHGMRGVPGQLKFGSDDSFYRELRNRVNDYFKRTGRSQRDCPRMYLKTAMVLVWFAASYTLLVFMATTWWVAAALAISLALSMAAIGFNIQHDGSHGAYSKRQWINKSMALSLDLLGGSSYGWSCKHNIVHHTYSNITGHDDDIDIGFLGRLTPHQKHYSFHRWQHIYLWLLYGFVSIKWHFYDDFRDLIIGRFGGHAYARPKGWDLVTFIGGKLLFVALALGIPLLAHPLWTVLAFYAAVSFVEGIALSMVFQLPHCAEKAAFPLPHADTGRMETPWAVHQVQTTVNYARGNRLLSWYVGGLNFQIEHHLFPRICHVNYSALAPLVEQTCQEFGVIYQANETFRSALASHFRWLRKMGMPGAV